MWTCEWQNTEILSYIKICIWLVNRENMRHMFRKVIGGFMAPCLTYWKPHNLQEQQLEQPRTEIQTTINKIFLTSLQSEFETLKIFSLDAQKLARQIASHLDIGLGRLNSTKFNDGQINIQILDSIRGQNVFIIKNFQDKSVNDGIVELLLTVATMKKNGAATVTAILPFFPYALPSSSEWTQVNEGFDFFTCFGSDLVKMLQALGCDQIITLNTSMSAPKGFAFTSRFVDIDATELAAPYLIYAGIKDPVIVGSRSNRLHLRTVNHLYKTFKLFNFDCGMGFYNDGVYIGEDFKDRDVVLYSNMIRSGNTVKNLSHQLKKGGARNVYCYGFHAHCTNDQLVNIIDQYPIKELIMTNSIQHSVQNKKIRTISVAKFLAQVITIISQQKSLSDFRGNRQMLHYAYLTKIKQYNSKAMMEAKIANEKKQHESYVEKIKEYTSRIQKEEKEAQEREKQRQADK